MSNTPPHRHSDDRSHSVNEAEQISNSIHEQGQDQGDPADAVVMAPSFGMRFSGINATMEALLPIMREEIPIACCGKNLSQQMPRTRLWHWLRAAQTSKNRAYRIWHARRNNDMLVGIFLRYVLRRRLILLWTSAAQRKHTWLTRWCYRRMDAVIATTKRASEFLQCDATVSHHGVNVDDYQPNPDRTVVRNEIGLPPDRRTLGVFGRIRPQKGTCDLLAALCKVLPHYDDWQIVFVGQTTAEYQSYLDQQKERLLAAGVGDRVHFTGFLKNFAELPRWYQAMDAVGCVSRNEGFGITCLEAMASGCPVLGTTAGAWPDIISPGEDGWIAQAGCINDIAKQLEQLLGSDQKRLAMMGHSARAKMEREFTIQHESGRIIKVYEKLLKDYNQQSFSAYRSTKLNTGTHLTSLQCETNRPTAA